MKKLLLSILFVSLLAGCSSQQEQEPIEMVEVQETGNVVENTGVSIEAQEDVEPIKKEPIGIKVQLTLTEEFVNKYKYEDSCNYRVGLNVDGNYYDVFRNENNGVANDIKHGLTGAIAMCDLPHTFRRGDTRTILFGEQKWARDKGEYGYIIKDFEYKEDYEFYVSGVKEGVEIGTIHWEYIY